MNNLQEALEYVVAQSTPYREKIGFIEYSDKTLYPIKTETIARTLKLSTLSSLIDYIVANVDQLSEVIIHIESYDKVYVLSPLNKDRDREALIEVNAQIPTFDFGRNIDQERFLIGLQSEFLASKDRELLLRFAGTVESGTIAEYGDDGFSQKATVKTGVASKSSAIIPNPVTLIPYRTFVEVAQPASQFIFRMSDAGGVTCALFEADGGAWKIEAIANVKEYICESLQKTLGDNYTDRIAVIA